MLRNYFKIAWRNIFKNKTQSFINISGLSVGLACSILIFLWVQNELAVDAFHANNDRLYKVYEREYYADHIDGNYDTPGLLAEELKKKIPEVEDAVMLEDQNELTTLQSGNKILKAEGSGASEGFFNMFNYPILQGMANSSLLSVTAIAISEKLANEFFGSPDRAMGKTIRYNNKKDYIVTAVFKTMSVLSSRKFDYLISWKALQQEEPWTASWQNSSSVDLPFTKTRNKCINR